MGLQEDFKEFIKLLNAHKVSYLVVGGYAVNFYGYPRFTKDIDLWIWLDAANIQKLLDVIREFGFASLGLTSQDFMNPENIIQLGYEPYRIDLLMDVTGLNFKASYEAKEIVEIDDVPVNFIHIQDLITGKKALGRLQDLADAEKLEQLSKKNK